MFNVQSAFSNFLDKKVVGDVTVLGAGVLLAMCAAVWCAVIGVSYIVSCLITG